MLQNMGMADKISSTDLKHHQNPQYVAEVAQSCTQHMLETEARLMPSQNCSNVQR